jgi:uncharacterized membrane protein YgcG
MSVALEPEYQEQLLALVPKFSAAVGLPSCILLMSEVILAHQKGKNGGNPILRSLGFVAFFLSLDALGWFLSTWAVPEGSFAFSAGNTQTCDFQGFLLQVVIGAPLFSMVVAWYFWLIVFWGKTAKELEAYERWVSPMIIIYAFGSAFFLLFKQMYNHIGAVCWIQGSPSGCGNSSFKGSGEVPCDRGDWAWLYGMVMFYLLLWICILCILCFNVSNYIRLRGDDDKEEASWFATQSFLYALAFVVTWAPSTTWSGLNWTADGGIFWVDLLAALFEPLGGFWNLLIFLHSRPASQRRVMRLLCLECREKTQDDNDEIDVDGPPPPPAAPLIAKQSDAMSQSGRSNNNHRGGSSFRGGGSRSGGSKSGGSSRRSHTAVDVPVINEEDQFSDEGEDDDYNHHGAQRRSLHPRPGDAGSGSTSAETRGADDV